MAGRVLTPAAHGSIQSAWLTPGRRSCFYPPDSFFLAWRARQDARGSTMAVRCTPCLSWFAQKWARDGACILRERLFLSPGPGVAAQPGPALRSVS